MLTSNTLGVVVFLAVLLHEAPAGFSIAAIILGAGKSRRIAVLAGGSIGVSTLIGIMVPLAPSASLARARLKSFWPSPPGALSTLPPPASYRRPARGERERAGSHFSTWWPEY